MEQFKKCNNPNCQHCPGDKFIDGMIFEESYNEQPTSIPPYNEKHFNIREPSCIPNKPIYQRDQPYDSNNSQFQREPPCHPNKPPCSREQLHYPNKPLCLPNKSQCLQNNACYPEEPQYHYQEPYYSRNPHCHPKDYNFQQNNQITEDNDIFEPNYSDSCMDTENETTDQSAINNNQYQRHFPIGKQCTQSKNPLYRQANDEYMISDEYLLNYLLRKYKLDKYKLIASIKKSKDYENKIYIMKTFYKNNKFLINTYKPFIEHWKIFKKWNCGRLDINKEELQDYYEEYVKSRIF